MEKDIFKRDYRSINLRTTDGSTFSGKVNIGLKQRVSDLFTKTEDPFIVLINVKGLEGSGDVLIVNKNNIVWVEPIDIGEQIPEDRVLTLET
jgi:hypothetical protein